MLRKMIGPERDEITGEWRRLHYEELYDTYAVQQDTQSVLMSEFIHHVC